MGEEVLPILKWNLAKWDPADAFQSVSPWKTQLLDLKKRYAALDQHILIIKERHAALLAKYKEELAKGASKVGPKPLRSVAKDNVMTISCRYHDGMYACDSVDVFLP